MHLLALTGQRPSRRPFHMLASSNRLLLSSLRRHMSCLVSSSIVLVLLPALLLNLAKVWHASAWSHVASLSSEVRIGHEVRLHRRSHTSAHAAGHSHAWGAHAR